MAFSNEPMVHKNSLKVANEKDELTDYEISSDEDEDIWSVMFDEELERQKALLVKNNFNEASLSTTKNSNFLVSQKQPKRKRTAYLYYTSVCILMMIHNFLFDDNLKSMRGKVSSENQGLLPAEITKILATQWNSLSEEEKEPYKRQALEDQDRWESEKRELAEKYKLNESGDHILEQSSSQKKRGGKKREKKWTKDPLAPKKAKNPYILYGQNTWSTVWESLKESDQDYKITDIMKVISTQWNNITPEEREKFEIQAREDKERFKREMDEYNAKKSSEPIMEPWIMSPPPVNLPVHNLAPFPPIIPHQIPEVPRVLMPPNMGFHVFDAYKNCAPTPYFVPGVLMPPVNIGHMDKEYFPYANTNQIVQMNVRSTDEADKLTSQTTDRSSNSNE